MSMEEYLPLKGFKAKEGEGEVKDLIERERQVPSRIVQIQSRGKGIRC